MLDRALDHIGTADLEISLERIHFIPFPPPVPIPMDRASAPAVALLDRALDLIGTADLRMSA